MLKIEKTETYGWETAIRGMRNPLNSWKQSDSCYENGEYKIGPKDYDLMVRLRNAGTDHRKFMRMIIVTADITGPLYWWKDYDTYKVGTVANSCSTMHKLADRDLTLKDFSHEHLEEFSEAVLCDTIYRMNGCLREYKKTGDKMWWWQMIQLLPTSYNQKRTVMLNYEVLSNIYRARRHHKLDEFHQLCDWIYTLPHSELITGEWIK